MNPTLFKLPPVPERYRPLVPYAVPIASLLLAMLMALFYLGPSAADTLSLKVDTDTDAARVNSMTDKIKTLQGLDQGTLTDELAKTEAALPSTKDEAGFLSNFNQIAAASGATLDTSQLVGNVKETDKNALDFDVTVKGNFATIKGFLSSIETARRVMVVKSININMSSSGVLSAALTITGYYEPTPSVSNVEMALPVWSKSSDKVLSDLDARTNYVPPTEATPSASTGRSDPFASF